MNKKFITIVLAAVGIIFFSSLLIPKSKDLPEQEIITTNEIQTNSALLVLDYGDGSTATFTFEISEETTAFSLLKNTADKENIPLDTQVYDFGVFIKSVNGLESTAEKAWIYFVNNESGTVAADQKIIKPGDVVEWKYITPSY